MKRKTDRQMETDEPIKRLYIPDLTKAWKALDIASWTACRLLLDAEGLQGSAGDLGDVGDVGEVGDAGSELIILPLLLSNLIIQNLRNLYTCMLISVLSLSLRLETKLYHDFINHNG